MVTMAVGAHPDDVEFGCFGTLAKWNSVENEDIVIVIFTQGEKGGKSTQRKVEAKNSGSLIDSKLIFLGEKDGFLQHDMNTVSALRSVIQETHPSRILAPYFDDTHQDHVSVSRIVLSSSKLIDTVMFFETPSTINMEPNYYVDITGTFDLKSKALLQHRSQSLKNYFDLDQVKGLASYRAWQCNKRNSLFEAFYLFREID